MAYDKAKPTLANGALPSAPTRTDRHRRRVWRPSDDPECTSFAHREEDEKVVAGRLAAKYLLLDVPNWNRAEDEADQMGSYLRLGSVPDPSIAGAHDAPRATGEDLAAYATTFLDDDRVRDGCPGFVPVEERKAETARLHTKGGWRDHSDGNRVTTTRGDKVEVIRGNYQLVVLGRQDEAGGATGWDVSGGHIEGVGGKSSIEWKQSEDGSWKTHEASERGDTHVIQHGKSVNRNYGESQDNTTGSEDEMRPSWDPEGKPVFVFAPNPTITDRTWARQIDSYTGSSACRVPASRASAGRRRSSRSPTHAR
ncbi:Putative cell-wall-anchored protein SasA (LPXTG motif) [Minicystis rosea]|nr:Putative cell-wall-anchored protein SasA (LPXTG motif) [Minicystis rosea]